MPIESMSSGRRQRGSGAAAVAFRPIGPIRRRFNRAATEGCGRDAFPGLGMPRGPSPCGCRAALRRGAALPQQPPAGQPTTSTGGSLGHPFEVGCIASDHRCGRAPSRTHSVRCPRSRYLCPGQCASPGSHTLAWALGCGRSSTFRFGWVSVQSGSDNEVAAWLRSLSGFLVVLGQGSGGRRLEGVRRVGFSPCAR